MLCFYCNHPRTAVVNSRGSNQRSSVWRRRQCQLCKKIFTTREEPAVQHMPLVTSRHQPPEPLSAFRLALSIKPTLDPSIPPDHAYELAKTATDNILRLDGKQTITASLVAKAAYNVLLSYNKRAAIQYGARYDLIDL